MSKPSKHRKAAAPSPMAPPVTPLRSTPGATYEETLTDYVSAELVIRACASENASANDRLSVEVEITAEDQGEHELEVLLTARGLHGAPDPDIQGDSRPGAENQQLLALDGDALLLLYRALGSAIAMAVESGMVRLPQSDRPFPSVLPDAWRALRNGSPAVSAATVALAR